MKNLSKQMRAERDKLLETYRKHLDETNAAIEKANAAIETANGCIETLNGVGQELKGWADGVAEEMDAYYSERSEKWQEGEAGEQYSSWKDTFESADFTEVDAFEPLDEIDDDFGTTIEELPESPE